MKKSLTIVSIILLVGLATASVQAQTYNVPGDYLTIQAAINAAPASTTINVGAGTYTENVTVNKPMTIIGAGPTTIINPSSGIGVNVTADNVTLQNLKVTGTGDHGVWAKNVSNLTITNVVANGNGLLMTRSGIALQHVTGTSVLTNVTATNNKAHGLEIGNGSTNVQVNGGTFTGNGVAGNPSYGGGIMIYADASNATDGTSIFGAVTSSTNTTAGIYIFCDPNGELKNTTIGATGTITLHDNGSTGTYSGGAAVLVYGPCDHTTITATATNSGSLSPVAGLVVLGTDSVGTKSPTNTVTKGCNLSGFSHTSPAATMKANSGSTTYICVNDVDATDSGNLINGAANGYDVEDVLYHKVDDVTLGRFLGPGSTVYVTPLSGSIQNGIIAARPPFSIATAPYTNIQVKAGTYNESATLNLNWTAATLSGDGASTIINSSSDLGINISASTVTVCSLKVTGASKHGIWADNVSALNIHDVTVDGNGTANGASTIGSGIAVRRLVGSPVITNVTATNNKNHGLEIGDGCTGLTVSGGTFSNNGVAGYENTGGGIFIYSNGTYGAASGTIIGGTLTASNNTTAGIYIYSTPGVVTGTAIGQTGGDAITLSNNGSTGTDGSGGAGVLVYGGATSTTMSALFTRSSVVGGGLVVLGTDNLGTSSPSGTIVKNSTFTGYNTTPSPAITLASETFSGSWTTNAKICTTGVTATTNVTFTGATTSTAIDALIYDQKDNATLGLVSYTSPSILVKVKVFLQGPFNAGSMNTTLYSLGDIPTAQPYTVSPFNYAGSESATTPAGVVDWILVELRAVFNGAAVDRRAAFLKSDGSVVDVDGSSNLAFNSASAGNYYIVIKHRNHLAVMSAAPVSLPNASVYDFTTAQTQAYGAAPMKALTGGVYGMYVGDFDNNNLINATDLSVSNGYLTQSGTSGYKQGDFDMNGLVNASDGPLAQPNSGVATAVPNP